MKAVRISLLTIVLLAGATPGSVPVTDNALQGHTNVIAKAGDGPCYWINGMWVCER
jgi:hypothetical protein